MNRSGLFGIMLAILILFGIIYLYSAPSPNVIKYGGDTSSTVRDGA